MDQVRLSQPILFPPQSNVSSVTVQQTKQELTVMYHVNVPLNWEEARAYYQQRYPKARWIVSGASGAHPFYVVNVLRAKKERARIIIYRDANNQYNKAQCALDVIIETPKSDSITTKGITIPMAQ